MKTTHRNLAHVRAAVQLTLLWGCALAAASAWAAGIADVTEAPVGEACPGTFVATPAATRGWFRIVPGEHNADVLAMRHASGGSEPDNAMYVRLSGAALKEGAHRQYRYLDRVAQPKSGKEYQLTFGKTPFSFIVESDGAGTQLAVGYRGAMYRYLLGLPAAATHIDAIADLDGDGLPDFVVEVGDDTYLLLSTQARPGTNRPSAQLWRCGC